MNIIGPNIISSGPRKGCGTGSSYTAEGMHYFARNGARMWANLAGPAAAALDFPSRTGCPLRCAPTPSMTHRVRPVGLLHDHSRIRRTLPEKVR
jgi:hypothetical protein